MRTFLLLLLVIQADGSSVPYSGALKAPELRSFLDGFAATEQLLEGSAGGRQGGVSDPLSQLAQQVEVQPLSSSNLTDIDGQDDMWLIAFHATTGERERERESRRPGVGCATHA